MTSSAANSGSLPERGKRGTGRHRSPGGGTASLRKALHRSLGDSLFRNSSFLALNIVTGAVGGVAALSLLTRLYSVQAVGLTAAALSGTGLITAVSQLGLNYSLVRYLPESSHRAELINSVLTASMILALLSSGVFLLLPSSAQLYKLGGVAFAVLFVVSTVVAAGLSQAQNVFVADRAAKHITISSLFATLAKIAAPVALVLLGATGAYIAQSIPTIVAFAVLAAVLTRQGLRLRPMVSGRATRDLVRFSLGTYVAGLFGTVPLLVLPLVILARFGPAANAYWYTAMSAGVLLFQLPGSVGTALLAEAAHQPSQRRKLVRRASKLILTVMTPTLLAAYWGAPIALKVLGHGYSMNSLAPLRWLIVAAAMSSINYVTGTILYLAKKAFTIALINVVDAVVVVGLAAVFARGVRDVALSWVIGEIGNVALFGLFAIKALREVGWKWESLGVGRPSQRPFAPAPDPAFAASQRAGLEVLVNLAYRQEAGVLLRDDGAFRERRSA